jgi:hypothetical protein
LRERERERERELIGMIGKVTLFSIAHNIPNGVHYTLVSTLS